MINPIEIISELEENRDELETNALYTINQYDILEGITRLNAESRVDFFSNFSFNDACVNALDLLDAKYDREKIVDDIIKEMHPSAIKANPDISHVNSLLSEPFFRDDQRDKKELVKQYENNGNYGDVYVLDDTDVAVTLLDRFTEDEIKELMKVASFRDICENIGDMDIDYMDILERRIRSEYDI